MYEKYISVLAESPLFYGVKSEEVPLVLDCLQPREVFYQKGEYIAAVGGELPGMGVIAAGRAAVLRESASGDRVVMAILEPGHLFGEIAACAEEPRWPATVQAQVDTVVLFIPGDRIVGRCTEDCIRQRLLIKNLLRIVSERALMLNRKVYYLTIKSLRGRISALLLDHYRKTDQATFTLPFNRNEMADFLNVSRPSMSREMSRLKEEGVIDYHLATFRILDPGALESFASVI